MVLSEDDDRIHVLRNKIIGLSDTSHRKSYYPQLKEQISELNQALLALQESENKYRTLVENVNIGIIRSEPWEGGHIIQANPAAYRILGYDSEKELTEVAAEDIYMTPADRFEILKELRQTGKVKDRKVMFRLKDGSAVLCSITFSVQYDADGKMLFLDGVIEDITERERKAEALRQANNKLNLLHSITLHDIINQVTVLEGYLSLVMERVNDPDINILLQRMEANVMSIGKHITFTKDYQEIGLDAPQWSNLLDVLTSAMVPVDKALINLRIDVKDYLIFSDPMIKKVFYNLANNVIKHSNASHLTITTVEEDDHLLVVFQDDGIGIKDKGKLFKKGSSGSGYGLFLSKEILSITDIKIRETGIPGKGARFELVFSPGNYKPAR